MSLRETRARDLDLNALMEGIEAGEVVLPNFQRDFDWTDSDVRALLGTVLSGWPLGSLLLIEGGDRGQGFYDPRSVELAPPVSHEDVVFIILDGQQRLTALYQALYNRGRNVYALSLKNQDYLSDIDVLDESLLTVKADTWNRHFSTPSEQWHGAYLPISALRTATTFFAWRDEAIPREDLEGIAHLTDLYTNFLSGLHRYKVPSVVIPKAIEPAAVARIFERVNRNGMKLGAFDLMVAKSFSEGFNLRALWDEGRTARPLLRWFLEEDGLPVLTVLALRQRNDLRQSAVLELTGAGIRDGWQEALEHYDTALHFAVRRLGILSTDWVPYGPILTVLAAVDYDVPLAENEALIRRWYWATALGGRYDVASNTRAAADFGLLTKAMDPIRAAPVFRREAFLESTKRQQGALHRAFLAAMSSKLMAAGSLHVNDDGTPPALVTTSLFPRDDAEMDPPAHLRTLSFVLRRANDRAADPYVAEMFLESIDRASTVDQLLEQRLNRLRNFASDEIGDLVRIVSEVDDAAITQ